MGTEDWARRPDSTVPFASQQDHLLVERLHALLAALPPLLRDDATALLSAEGKLLAPSPGNLPHGQWAQLPFLIARSLESGINVFYASTVAVAVECLVCALDYFDEIEDDDQSPTLQKLGLSRVLCASTVLLTLSQQAILDLRDQADIPPSTVLRLLDTLQSCTLAASVGQQQDLVTEAQPLEDMTYDQCIAMIAGKSGSLMRLACVLGAQCANADQETCEQFGRLGELLGIVHQLDNDCHDLYSLLEDEERGTVPLDAGKAHPFFRSGKTDLVRSKKTLPVFFANQEAPSLQFFPLSSDEERKKQVQALTAGIIAAWGVCLWYRDLAKEQLQTIAAHRHLADELLDLFGLSS